MTQGRGHRRRRAVSPSSGRRPARAFSAAASRNHRSAKPGILKKSLETAHRFLKSPLEYIRISSPFGSRFHPVTHRHTMHQGIDFAAPAGTPIHATADGVIDFLGRHGGHGNYVRIRHDGVLQTAYAHMSRFVKGLRSGSSVKKGQVIGYVGSTGLSTGPHLHYEVLRNGAHIDPHTVHSFDRPQNRRAVQMAKTPAHGRRSTPAISKPPRDLSLTAGFNRQETEALREIFAFFQSLVEALDSVFQQPEAVYA